MRTLSPQELFNSFCSQIAFTSSKHLRLSPQWDFESKKANSFRLDIHETSSRSLLPERAIRTFYHKDYYERWRYNDVVYYMRNNHSIAVSKDNTIDIYVEQSSEELSWNALQCIRVLAKRIALTHGFIYLPCLVVPAWNLLIAGHESCGRLIIAQMLHKHFNLSIHAGICLIHTENQWCQWHSLGTPLSMTEHRAFNAMHSKPEVVLPSYRIEEPHLILAQRWYDTSSIIQASSWDTLRLPLVQECMREYEFHHPEDLKALKEKYDSIQVRCSSLFLGDDQEELLPILEKLNPGYRNAIT